MMDRIDTFRPVGTVRTDPDGDVVIQARYAPVTRGVVELDPALVAGLDGLAGFDWAWLVTLLDRAVDPRDRDDVADALRPVPFLLADRGTPTGIFASRYPARPNRIGLSLVRIERVDGARVEFSGVDVFDGTPVLDLKPWVRDFDLPAGATAPSATRSGWFDTLAERPMTLDDPGALVLVARELAGRAAMVVRSVAVEGIGSASPGELAIFDRHGCRAGRLLRGALDGVLVPFVADALDRSGGTTHLLELDVDDETARGAGLTCSGHARLVVQPLDHVPSRWWDDVAARRPVALVTELDTVGQGAIAVRAGVPVTASSSPFSDRALALIDAGRSRGTIEESDTGRVLIEATIPVTRLMVVGAAALADDLVALAHWLGWSAVQYPAADDARAELASLGPRDAVVVLDHGLTATAPLLADALAGTIGYVGALGSRRTQARRAEHLRGLGVDEQQLQRLHGPTGLDLGPTNAQEIALSILAEIAASRAGRSARPLTGGTDRIMR
jgi:xanthine dehydrogenase accessory factor